MYILQYIITLDVNGLEYSSFPTNNHSNEDRFRF